MRRSFAERSAETELMDTEPVGLEEFGACLADLAAVNTLTLAHAPTLAWLRRATRGMRRGDQFSLVDVGYGYGDLLRAIDDWCRARGFEPDLVGIDLNPSSAASAQKATPPHMSISYRTGDVFAFTLERPVQFIVSSLFTHHLTDARTAAFVAWMERTATKGWFINDLHRHPVPFHAFRILARLARWHRFVQHDGPVSIARGFRTSDWKHIVAKAELSGSAVEIARRFPFRICVSRLR